MTFDGNVTSTEGEILGGMNLDMVGKDGSDVPKADVLTPNGKRSIFALPISIQAPLYMQIVGNKAAHQCYLQTEARQIDEPRDTALNLVFVGGIWAARQASFALDRAISQDVCWRLGRTGERSPAPPLSGRCPYPELHTRYCF